MADIDAPREAIERDYFLALWIDMWLYTFSVGLSKFVILGLYWRLFGRSLIRQPIRILSFFSVLWIIGRVLLILLQCRPITKFWNTSLPGTCPLTPMISLFAAGISHFVLEVAILLCPLIEIWRLHLATPKKLAVAVMFTSGLLVCASALGTIVHTVELSRKVETDLTWDGLDDQIWAVCDVNLASLASEWSSSAVAVSHQHALTVLAASLPLLRPVFRSFGGIFRGLKSSSLPVQASTIDGVDPRKRVRMRTRPRTRTATAKRKEGDSDSVVEFAHERPQTPGSDKTYALHDVSPRVSDVERQSEGVR
jgi:hypothetical protein